MGPDVGRVQALDVDRRRDRPGRYLRVPTNPQATHQQILGEAGEIEVEKQRRISRQGLCLYQQQRNKQQERYEGTECR